MASNCLYSVTLALLCVVVYVQSVASVQFSLDNDGTAVIDVVGQGKIRGNVNGNSANFLGIRYAFPPTGERRWKAPEMYEVPWEGVLNGTYSKVSCPQRPPSYAHPDSYTSEDCLFLNVWMPVPTTASNKEECEKLEEEELLPVVVFIHGGTFIADSGTAPYIDGQVYNDEKTLLVSINYRLGLLGFMAHPALTESQPTHPTNFGLLDQRAAVEWVAKYIHNFGGDPNRITLMGQSAGAISITAHLSAPRAAERRFFNQAVLLSAVPWYPFVPLKVAEEKGEHWARLLGCETPNKTEELRCLRSKDAELFIERGPRFVFFHAFIGTITGPVIDKVNFGDSSLRSFQRGHFDTDIPLVIGTTEHEGRLFVHINFLVMTPTPEYYEELVHTGFAPYVDEEQNSKLVHDLLDMYNLTAHYANSTFESLSEMVTDSSFTCPVKDLLNAVAHHQMRANGRHDVYGYLFSQYSKNTTIQYLGAFHGCELAYAFATSPGIYWTQVYEKDEYEMALNFVRYITSFAANRKPGFAGAPVEWPLFLDTKEERKMLLIRPNLTAIQDYRTDQCDFWISRFPDGIPLIALDVLKNEPFLSVFANDHFVTLVEHYRSKPHMYIAPFCVALFVGLSILYTSLRPKAHKPHHEEHVKRKLKRD